MKTANEKNELKLKVTYTDKHSSHFNHWHNKVVDALVLKLELQWMIDEYQAVALLPNPIETKASPEEQTSLAICT